LRDLDDISVQLEFPGGEPVAGKAIGLPAPTAIAGEAGEASPEPSPEASDDAFDDEELVADDEDEPSASDPEVPTLVAAPHDSQER